LDSQSTLRVIRSKANADDLVLYIQEKDGDAPVHIENYRFKKGYTLRFNDCGQTQEKRWKITDSNTTEEDSMNRTLKSKRKTPDGSANEKKASVPVSTKTFHWKELHVYFPDDRWNTGFHHETWTQDHETGYGSYDEVHAKHNVLSFSPFMDELERRLKEEKVKNDPKFNKEEAARAAVGKGRNKGRKRENAEGKPELEDAEGRRLYVLRRRMEGGELVPDVSVRATGEEEEWIVQERAVRRAEEEADKAAKGEDDLVVTSGDEQDAGGGDDVMDRDRDD
jgi:hypothetical protein